MSRCVSLAAVVTAALALAVPALPAHADDAIQVDRPDFTDSAFTMPVDRLQLEAGALRTKQGTATEDDLGQASFRYGLAEGFELRIEPGSWARQRGGGDDASGWDGGDAGFKWRLRKGEGRSPTLAIEATAGTPWGSRAVAARAWQPQVLLAASTALDEQWAADFNLGGASQRDGDRRFKLAIWSVSVSRQLSDTVATFGEYFGDSREQADGSAVHRLDAGVTWQARRDLQFDVWGGATVRGDGPDWYAGGGFAVRF